jgi:hypothetical protein
MQDQSPGYFIDHHMVAWGDKVKSKYVIDNNTLTQDHKKILRLPTYHPCHILTELVWADVKQGFTIKNMTFMVMDVKVSNNYQKVKYKNG